MAVSTASTANFLFDSAKVTPGALKVSGFVGEERILEPFRFTIALVGEDPDLDFSDLLDKPTTLTIRPPLETDLAERCYHGIIASVTQTGREAESISYEVELVPRLWRLGLYQNCRIFQNKTVIEIIEQVLKDRGLSGSDVKMDLKEKYSPWEYCTQYMESDLAFISRLMENRGIFFFFDHSGENEVLVIADHAGAIAATSPTATLRYRDPSALVPPHMETVAEMTYCQQVITSKVTLKDYNYNTPTAQLLSTSQIETVDDYESYRYPGGFGLSDAGDKKAHLRNEEIEISRETIHGRSDCRSLTAGYRFTLEEHYRKVLNTDYLLTHVHHEGSQGGFKDTGAPGYYRNEFECIPMDVPYRPPRKTARPRIVGTQTAVVVGPKGEKLYMDDLGRAKVQFHWDREGKNDEHSSCWVRVSHAYAGHGHGNQFHPLIGDEVIVDFLEGNPDRPIITGRVYHADNTPPLKPGNRIQNIIKTPYGHTLLLDDAKANINLTTGGSETINLADGAKGFGNNIKISTADKHSMQLAEGGDLQGITIQTQKGHLTTWNDGDKRVLTVTTDGHSLLMSDADKVIVLSTPGNHIFTLSDKQKQSALITATEHYIVLDDAKGGIEIQTSKKHRVLLDDAGQKIQISSKDGHRATIDDAGKSITLQDADGQHMFKIDIGGKKLTITTKSGAIDITAPAGDITISGKAIKVDAKTSLTLHGANVEMKADMSANISGAMVQSSASGINIVKGGMVQLNP